MNHSIPTGSLGSSALTFSPAKASIIKDEVSRLQICLESQRGEVRYLWMPRTDLRYAGNLTYASPDILLSLVTKALKTRGDVSEPAPVLRMFLDLSPEKIPLVSPDEWQLINQSFQPPSLEEPHVFYSGCRSLHTAHSVAASGPLPMFITTDLGEAHRYSHHQSVVLKFCAKSTLHQEREPQNGALEYTEFSHLEHDGVRLIGIIPGRGTKPAQSIISGANFD